MRILALRSRRTLLLFAFFLLFSSVIFAQETPRTPGDSSAKKPLAVNKQPQTANNSQESNAKTSSALQADKARAELIQKREDWFYRQRSSANGRIPAGARLKAFHHMQRMMEAEGKLVRRPDGGYAAVAVEQLSALQSGVTSSWTPIGPTPTTGGTFSPVTGRVTAIAVDPSDSTGNTVLLGGAQGGIWRTTNAGANWTPVGDQNPSLAMGSIAFAPSLPSTVYAGTGEQAGIGFDIYYGAGVLKSVDHGLTWTQTCTVAGPTCPFIGPSRDITPFGYFTLGGTRISYVAVNPSNPQMLLVGAQTIFAEGPTEGVYCSDNGGSTWSNILPDQMSTFVGFASPTEAFVALGNPFGSRSSLPNGNGIYHAANVGSSCASMFFSRLTTSLPAQSAIGRIDLGISPNYSSDRTVYASIADASTFSSSNLGVFVTNDGGTSWTPTAAPDVCLAQCWYDNAVKVAPDNKNVAFFAGSSVTVGGAPAWVVRTMDGGANWSTVIPNVIGPGLPHVDNHALAFAKLPTGRIRLYLGNDGGVWRTDDAEAPSVSWINLNNASLTLTQFYPSISMNTSSPAFSFGGTQDNGSQNYQGGRAWVDNQLCGDGATTAVDTVVPSTVYIGCGTGYAVNASYQNGAIGTFTPAVTGINPNDFSSFIPPITVDSNVSNTLYFGTTKVYQSLDAALSWTPISWDLANGSNGDAISTIAVAPGNSGVLYAGTTSGLVYTATNVTAGSANFFQIGSSYFPGRAVSAIAIDPADQSGNTAYVSLSGFSLTNTNINDPAGHIFKTTNGGSTFVDVSCSVAQCSTPAVSDLPNIPVNDVVVDPEVPHIIYAATDLGVYLGDCTSTPCVWHTLGTGLPHVAVFSLRLHAASRTLRAATHGRGAWDIFLNNLAFSGPRIFSITPTSANAGGTTAVTLTVTGTGLTGGTIHFGTTALATTGTPSDTSLSGTILPAQLVAGSTNITVKTSTTSNSVPFEILALSPTITSINPSSTPVQTPPSPPLANIPIQFNGTNFSSTAKVLFNGAQSGITVAAPTSSCPLPTCLIATLPSPLLGPFGSTNDIAVLNAPPGGGKSNTLPFKVAAQRPPNDNFANATNISVLSFGDVQDSSNATTESGDPVPPCVTQFTSAQGNTGGQLNGRYNSIWYKFAPTFSANLSVDTTGSSYDTVLSIWTGAPGSLTNLACNDDIQPGIIIQSQLSNVPLTAGTTYYLMVSSFGPPDPNPIALGGKTLFYFSYNAGNNPSASVTSMNPTTVKSGDPGFTLTVNGVGFLNGATIIFLKPRHSLTPPN